MKLNLDTKKGTEIVSGALQKTTDISKKVAVSVQKGALELAEKKKNENYLRRLKKLNPLFPEQYWSENFKLPNMIQIVDDAVRRDIDVCEGAIGWISNEKDVEVLHLYDEFVSECGLQFVPAPVCDAAYYVDRFDRKRFVQVECLFDKAHEEKMAELEYIAYSLGAKTCTVKIVEEEIQKDVKKSVFGMMAQGKGASMEAASTDISRKRREGTGCIKFGGHQEPKIPQMKWFAYDEGIKQLIEMRCSDLNSVQSKVLRIKGNACSVMSRKTAQSIDSALSHLGGKASKSMETEVVSEHSTTLEFTIEF